MKHGTMMFALAFLASIASTVNAQTLRIQGDHFTVDAAPKFLLFVSYFDAMRREASGDTNPLAEDFAFFSATVNGVQKVDGIRIFVSWWDCTVSGGCGAWANGSGATDSLFDFNGAIRDSTNWSGGGHDPWTRFVNVLTAAKAYHLLVDVTFTRDTMRNTSGNIPSVANYQTGIVNVVDRLRTNHSDLYAVVFFDVQNEWSAQGFSGTDMHDYVNALHSIDSSAVATSSQSGSASTAGADAAAYGFDIVEFHSSRDSSNWYTATTVSNEKSSIRAFTTIPIVYGEPKPWDDDPSISHFSDAAKFAKQYGVAVWTFHTRCAHSMACSGCTYKSFADTTEEGALGSARSAATTQQWGARLAFTDSPLVAQTTVVKAAHVIELRARIDALRGRWSVSPYSWTDATLAPGSTVVKAVHVTQLRSALTDAYTAAGQSAPSYAASVSAGTTIAASHFSELRTKVEWLEAQ